MAEENRVFISYRRDGGDMLAMLLYTCLKEDGYQPFLDIETLRSGKFNEQLYHKIEECDDFICILPPHGLDRCINEHDWVRLEIAKAIKLKKNIIPILMRGFEFPSSLPEDIFDLQWFNGISANHEYFDASYEKLKTLLISEPNLAREQDTNLKVKDRFLSLLMETYETITSYHDGFNHGDQKKVDASAIIMTKLFRQIFEYSEIMLTSAPDRAKAAADIISLYNSFVSAQNKYVAVRNTNPEAERTALEMMNTTFQMLSDALVNGINQVQLILDSSEDILPKLDVLLMDAYHAVNSHMNALNDGNQQGYNCSIKLLMNTVLSIEKYRRFKMQIDPLGAEVASAIVDAYNTVVDSLSVYKTARQIDIDGNDCAQKEMLYKQAVMALKQTILSAIQTR